MLPILASAGRAAAKSAVKKTAQKAAKVASRARRAGDDAYNARKRYTRAAQRYLDKAKTAVGETKERFKQLAKQNFDSAMSTYDPSTKQKFSKGIQNLADEFGIDLEGERGSMVRKRTEAERKSIIERSFSRLERNIDPDIGPKVRREQEAKILLSDSSIGRRVMGGLVDIWGEFSKDPEKLMQSLFDYFKTDNFADIIEQIEQKLGDQLYQDPDSEEKYDSIKLAIQRMVANDTLVD